ncbi:sialate O-acetylesterase [Sphingomonas zeicaulis]|uniref:sialate O-acetylesterase n=1 Tax=Sphingomonas zeicaulis TaxID=1632740 RepID=UPI003D2426A0
MERLRRNLRHARKLLPAWAVIGVAGTGFAEPPRVQLPMSDHAVVQRERPIAVSGTALPNERLSIKLAGRQSVVVADKQGHWRTDLRPLPAGGPYRLEVTAATGETTTLDDLLVGDVWLCSGQSNMEYPLKAALNGSLLVENAADPHIRLLSMAQRVAYAPETPAAAQPGWMVASPESAAEFSAACFLMAKALKTEQHVPVGAIDSSWGGTRIRPWIPAQQARRLPGAADDIALLSLYNRDPAAAINRFADRWGTWWRGASGDARGSEPWNAPDRRNWRAVPRISAWEDWGLSETAALNGMVWFRQAFDLADPPSGPAVLDLGGIDELDIAWVNGIPVGSSFGWGTQRQYNVPASALRAGRNDIIVAVSDSWGTGGMLGPAAQMQVRASGGRPIPLASGWRFSLEKPLAEPVPRMPWESHAGLSTLYNGMVAPLGNAPIKGVAWYQGESDAGIAGYDDRLKALMAGWRQQFGDPALPFIIIGLANYGELASAPGESGWATVRDEQRRVAMQDEHAAIVTTVDIGEQTDIHPANKNELAKRMARAATALAYGGNLPASGPLATQAKSDGDDVLVSFAGVTGQLRASSAAGPIGFELCNANLCRFAQASIDGSSVRLRGDGAAVDRVRYAWADAPIANLFDDAALTPAPFQIMIEKPSAR